MQAKNIGTATPRTEHRVKFLKKGEYQLCES